MDRTMLQVDWMTVIGFFAVPGSLRNLHRDMAGIHRDIGDLRERMARVEGLLEGCMGRHGKEEAKRVKAGSGSAMSSSPGPAARK